MWVEQDYKDCTRLSLRVMREMRDKVCKDSIEHHSVIYNGLHEFESKKVMELYFQEYEMEWLDSHWELLTSLLKQYNKDYKESERQEITLFFAEYFSALMTEVTNSSSAVNTVMRELIAAQKNIIEQMIEFADKWEERSNQLKVNLKKHKEHYKRLIESVNADERKGNN